MALTNTNNRTKIFGILGNPLAHTLSPLIHNGLFNIHNYNAIYLVFERENPEEFLNNCHKLFQVKGLSVTIPYKEIAYKVSNQKDNISEYMQASNTLLFQEDMISAYNTDGYGAVQAILKADKQFFATNQSGNILILGSGGSAKGISYALVKEGVGRRKILIAARNSQTGVDLQNRLNSLQEGVARYLPLSELENYKYDIELIVNTTPIGMKGQQKISLVPQNFIYKKHMVFDIVYNPIQTDLVEKAIKAGATIIPGYEMLIYQAIKQFQIFTGIQPNKTNIYKIKRWVEKKLEEK